MFEPSPGDALFSFYPIRPYLRRNVRKAVRHLIMGSAFSSRKPDDGEELRDDMASDDEGARRAAKRQKTQHCSGSSRNNTALGNRQPLGQVIGGNGRSTRIPEEIPPALFYGHGKVKADSRIPAVPDTSAESENVVRRSTSSSIKAILPEKPHFFQESLRVDNIEFFSIIDDEDTDEDVRLGQEIPFDIKCKCSAAIFYAKNDQKPGDVGFKDYNEASRKNKFCILRIDKRHDGSISRKVVLPEPFIFKPENFYVPRKRRKENGKFLSTEKDYLNTFCFADKYNLHVYIEPLTPNEYWPPVAIDAPMDDEKKYPITKALRDGSLDRDDLYLFGSTSIFSNPPMLSPRKTSAFIGHRTTRERIQYELKLRLDWTLPNPHTKVNLKLPKLVPEPKLPNPPHSLVHGQASVSEIPGEERAGRNRKPVNYNVKVLSAIQQGKSPRKQNLPPLRSGQRVQDRGDISVKYTFHKGQSIEVGNQGETTTSGFDCLFCNCRNTSIDELRLHLHIDHSAFKFAMREKESEITFEVTRIDPKKHRGTPIIDQSKTFEMRKPKSKFDLEALLGGDEKWTTLRHRPDNNRWPLLPSNDDSSKSSSVTESRQSSPNTSVEHVDNDYLEKSVVKLPTRYKVFLVPRTNRPTYDSDTKQVLRPGDRLPENDGDHDEIWLHHRKHDELNDFTDVTAEEKEYLRLWNLFLVDEHLTSDKYLAQVVIRFAETYKVWIMEIESRRIAFTGHMEALRLRGVFDTDSLNKCIWILKSVEEASTKGKKREEANIPLEQKMAEVEIEKQRKPGDCSCGERPPPYETILCRGNRCNARVFHKECAEKLGRATEGKWECDDCVA